MNRVEVAPGVVLWPERLAPDEQRALADDVFARMERAPLYHATMPKSGAAMSVESLRPRIHRSSAALSNSGLSHP